MIPDVYFTDGYGISAARMEGDSWHMLGDGQDVLIPFVLRRVGDTGAFDAISPYGYSGIHVAPGYPPGDLARVWAGALRHWSSLGVASVFLRFSPFDLGSVLAADTLPGMELIRRGDTVLVPVAHGPDALWAGLDSTARNRVRKAERHGLTARIRPATIADLKDGSPFRTLYAQTMTRVGAMPKYFFDDRYYECLADGLGSALWIAEALDREATVVAAALLMVHGDRVHYHLGASDLSAIRLGCNNLLFWTFLRWAGERGARLVHLGGGLSAGDSLFHFKTTFGGHRGQFWTGQVTVDAARYAALLTERARQLALPPARLAHSGYFPAYRYGMG